MAGGVGVGGFGNGFGYLLLEGNSSTRIPPRGRLQSPPDSGTSGSRRNWEGAVSGSLLFTALGKGGVGRGLTAFLKSATYFFFFFYKTQKTPHPNTMNTELAHWGPAPAWGQGSGLMHFGR